MKKFIFPLLFLAIIFITTFAGIFTAENFTTIYDTDGNAISNLIISDGETIYSKPIRNYDNVGFAAVILTENHTSTSGLLDLSTEYADDTNGNFLPYSDSDMSGNLTDEGLIANNFNNSTKRIAYQARLGKYVRYKLTADGADARATITHVYQQDR